MTQTQKASPSPGEPLEFKVEMAYSKRRREGVTLFLFFSGLVIFSLATYTMKFQKHISEILNIRTVKGLGFVWLGIFLFESVFWHFSKSVPKKLLKNSKDSLPVLRLDSRGLQVPTILLKGPANWDANKQPRREIFLPWEEITSWVILGGQHAVGVEGDSVNLGKSLFGAHFVQPEFGIRRAIILEHEKEIRETAKQLSKGRLG